MSTKPALQRILKVVLLLKRGISLAKRQKKENLITEIERVTKNTNSKPKHFFTINIHTFQ